MIISFYIAGVLTLLAEHHLNTGWLLHALLAAGAIQVIISLINRHKLVKG